MMQSHRQELLELLKRQQQVLLNARAKTQNGNMTQKALEKLKTDQRNAVANLVDRIMDEERALMAEFAEQT